MIKYFDTLQAEGRPLPGLILMDRSERANAYAHESVSRCQELMLSGFQAHARDERR